MKSNFYNAQIMILDDSPESIEVAANILKKADYQLKVAINANIAIDLIKKDKPTIILLDVNLPDVDGFTFCEKLKNDKNYMDIPIIFLTASNDEKSIQKAFNIGACDYVTKPFNAKELLARVNTQIKLYKQQKELIKAYNELDSFCDIIAHDLKAPLLSIHQLINIFQEDYKSRLNGDGNDLLQVVDKKSLELIEMIRYLLNFSRAGKSEIKKTDINMQECCKQIFSEMVDITSDRDIVFNVGDLPTISGDKILIKQFLQNIISNAIKYTSVRKKSIIEFTCEAKNNVYVFCCKDNGVGFDMRYADKLFRVFERLHSSREFPGNGVGLAICKRIIQRHGGKIWLESEVDKGTKCWFTIPK